MVTRLSSQKGIDLVIDILGDILGEGTAFVLLGSGDSIYEDYFLKLSKKFPDRIGVHIGFDEKLAHQILAGTDFLLMPSQYEPCGLTQMYSLKYGAIPIVRSVGGLADSIKEFNLKTMRGTGFKFKKFAPDNLHRTVQKAVSVYRKKNQWQRLTLNNMNANFGWDRAAKKYCQLYRRVLIK